MFVCTVADGKASGFPDACYTPAGTSVVSVPYQNLALLNQADGNTVAQKVFIDGAKAMNLKTTIKQSIMNEAGTQGGVVSAKNRGPASFQQGSMILFIEGAAAVMMGSPTGQNGNPFNTLGAVTAPSQTIFMCKS